VVAQLELRTSLPGLSRSLLLLLLILQLLLPPLPLQRGASIGVMRRGASAQLDIIVTCPFPIAVDAGGSFRPCRMVGALQKRRAERSQRRAKRAPGRLAAAYADNVERPLQGAVVRAQLGALGGGHLAQRDEPPNLGFVRVARVGHLAEGARARSRGRTALPVRSAADIARRQVWAGEDPLARARIPDGNSRPRGRALELLARAELRAERLHLEVLHVQPVGELTPVARVLGAEHFELAEAVSDLPRHPAITNVEGHG
jgi:hypothetical protein